MSFWYQNSRIQNNHTKCFPNKDFDTFHKPLVHKPAGFRPSGGAELNTDFSPELTSSSPVSVTKECNSPAPTLTLHTSPMVSISAGFPTKRKINKYITEEMRSATDNKHFGKNKKASWFVFFFFFFKPGGGNLPSGITEKNSSCESW